MIMIHYNANRMLSSVGNTTRQVLEGPQKAAAEQIRGGKRVLQGGPLHCPESSTPQDAPAMFLLPVLPATCFLLSANLCHCPLPSRTSTHPSDL